MRRLLMILATIVAAGSGCNDAAAAKTGDLHRDTIPGGNTVVSFEGRSTP
jgi:hypothetical protein